MTRIMGRYIIEGTLAVGAQATVFKGYDQLIHKPCVLKAGASVKKEAFVSRELNHPFVVRAYDTGEHPEIGSFAAYEEIKDCSLQKWKHGKSPADIRSIALRIAEFISFLHHRGWLYNDFKPEHFFVTEDGIRVIDFGLCTRIEEAPVKKDYYYGSFPFISPELLKGQIGDSRSDLFAFGILLLNLFFPKEEWIAKPSLSFLLELSKRACNLKGFWRRLLLDLTAFEPSQRVASAQEIWKRLLPKKGRGSFLLFHPSGRHLLHSDDLTKKVLFARSASRLVLEEIENQAIMQAWKTGFGTAYFDLERSDLEDCCISLCETVSGTKVRDFFSALKLLERPSNNVKLLAVFHCPEALDRRQRSLLSFAISSISSAENTVHILITTTAPPQHGEEQWERLDIPKISKREIEEMIPPSFLNGPKVVKRLRDLEGRSSVLPEHVYQELQKELPTHLQHLWPSTARVVPSGSPFERLSVLERRMAAATALAGGSLRTEIFRKLWPKQSRKLERLITRLVVSGYLIREGTDVHLRINSTEILMRFRKAQLRQLAISLLTVMKTGEKMSLYSIARHARKKRVAAAMAIRLAKSAWRKNQKRASMNWFWRAFQAGGRLPKPILSRMVQFFLREAEIRKCQKILRSIRLRFGMSYHLAEQILDLQYQCDRLSEAERFVSVVLQRASARNHSRMERRFSLRQAGFFVLQLKFKEAQLIFDRFSMECASMAEAPNEAGLFFHFRGLMQMYSGNLQEAVEDFRKAIDMSHRFQSTSYMNLGIALARMGKSQAAEEHIVKSIALLAAENSPVSLPHAYNNLGVLQKQQGRIQEARDNYCRCIYLSRGTRNTYMLVASTINLAITYTLEGRTDRAIHFYRKASVLAKSRKHRVIRAFALTNLGLQYSIASKTQQAIRVLERAKTIRQDLSTKNDLAVTFEYLGITYLNSRDYKKAHASFTSSLTFLGEAAVETDRQRILTYLALVKLACRDLAGAHNLLESIRGAETSAFEHGLFHYATAAASLNDPKGFNADACREALNQAEISFRKAPSLFWLAKVYVLKSQFFFKKDHWEKGFLNLCSAHNIFSRLDASRELSNVERQMMNTNLPNSFIDRMAEKLPYRVLLLIKKVLIEKDPQQMISRILEAAREFTDMERAVLILEETPPRIFKSAGVDENGVNEICQISRSATQSAAEAQKPFVCMDVATDLFLKSRPSILNNRIVSIVCLPLHSDDRLLGYLYLDSRQGIESLATTDTLLLEIFASIVSGALGNCLALEKSIEQNDHLKASLGIQPDFPQMIGNSKKMKEILQVLYRLLDSDLPVLITGETGTGKELIARILHYSGRRKRGPFVAVNCPALTESLLESELFGHEKGAFTGATGMKKGVFEEAKDGTLFLDEIGDLPATMQVKFLRVLQDGEIRRVGGSQTLKTNARIILATNRNIEELVENKQFREDLYYRIKVAHMHLPPLRERQDDISALALFFLRGTESAFKKRIRGFSPEAMEMMTAYSWPGNVRQMKSEIERIVVLSDNEWILPADLSPQIRSAVQTVNNVPPQNASTLREMEKEIILDRLHANSWNIFHTARSLGLTRNGLYSKMKMYSIPRKQAEPDAGTKSASY